MTSMAAAIFQDFNICTGLNALSHAYPKAIIPKHELGNVVDGKITRLPHNDPKKQNPMTAPHSEASGLKCPQKRRSP